MYIKSFRLNGHTEFPLLVDTGSQISGIGAHLVRKYRLHVLPPGPNEPTMLLMADKSKVVKRIGTVKLPMTIHFGGGKPRAPYRCTKRLEVLNMDYDFLLGVDILPAIFPFDDIMNYLLLPSSISTPPEPYSSQFENPRTLRLITTVPDNSTMVSTNMMTEYVQDRIQQYFDKFWSMDEEIEEIIQRPLQFTEMKSLSDGVTVSGLQVSVQNDRRNVMVLEDITLDAEGNFQHVEVNATATIDDSDILSLSDQITDIGIGTVPPHELPQKSVVSTPADKEAEYKPYRDKLNAELKDVLDQNEKRTGFGTGEGSVVTLTIDPTMENKLYTRQYSLPAAFEEEVTKVVERWKTNNRTESAPVGCKYNSPLLAVKKKDEHGKMTGVRVCLDVRKLNQALLQDDKFQIPHILDMLKALAGGKIFGEFDLSEAYFQLQLSKESRPLTAFTWKGQQYMFVSCPYGIKHLPSHFQRYIASIFRDMPFVFCYIDNICFSSTSWKQHLEHARAIIDRLNEHNLRIKPTSTNLGNYQIKLLGHLISPHGIGIDPEKQQMILDWPKPMTGDQLSCFLGLGTFLRDHIRYYADIAAPFEKIKRSGDINWTPELDRQWQLFKRAFLTVPFLKFPDFNKRFVVATDASQTGVGGVLFQPDTDDNEITLDNIVAIVSKQLNVLQRRYPVTRKNYGHLCIVYASFTRSSMVDKMLR